jgi:hypothetical protein
MELTRVLIRTVFFRVHFGCSLRISMLPFLMFFFVPWVDVVTFGVPKVLGFV